MVQRDKLKSPKCQLLGNTNEAVVLLGGVACLALIETGLMISNVSETFYRNNLKKEHPLQDLDQLLQIEGASGQILTYLGYIAVDIEIPETEIKITAPVLVTPDTEYNVEIPLLIGTNVLKVIQDEGKFTGPNSVWKSSLDCLVRSLTNPTVFMVYASCEIRIPSNEVVTVKGIGGGCHESGSGVISAVDSLPGGLMIPESVVELENRNKVRLQVKNHNITS